MNSLVSKADDSLSPELWANATWKQRWQDSNYRLRQYIEEPSAKPPGHDLKRRQWVLLNRIRSGYGRYGSFMHRIGLRASPNCICGDTQTPQHVLICPSIGIRGDIKSVDEDFRVWLNDFVLDI